jgi:intracellular sulfur oxidation DsrE/DsrF family protein
MRSILAALCLGLVTLTPAYGQTPSYSSPQPSLDHPRKIVMSLSEGDPTRINEIIGNVGNIQKFYGADDVQIVLVVYGPGVHAVLNDESPVRPRIAGLLAIGITIEACAVTLQSLHKTRGDLIAGVSVVPNGLPEIVERQVSGYYYVRP